MPGGRAPEGPSRLHQGSASAIILPKTDELTGGSIQMSDSRKGTKQKAVRAMALVIAGIMTISVVLAAVLSTR